MRLGNFTTPLKARPTMYRGIEMRSRLEASWAAQLDRDKERGAILDWEYEPICFANGTAQYLPDFRVVHPVNHYIYLEIKPPNTPPEKWKKKMEVILDSEPKALLALMCGLPTDADFKWYKYPVSQSSQVWEQVGPF